MSFDLSEYAGAEVEVVISYVTDPFAGEVGLIVDDTQARRRPTWRSRPRASRTGSARGRCSDAPEGSPDNASDFERRDGLGGIAAVTATPDTLLFGFGLEQLDSDAARAEVVARILAHFAG